MDSHSLRSPANPFLGSLMTVRDRCQRVGVPGAHGVPGDHGVVEEDTGAPGAVAVTKGFPGVC
jgi:hypothetical protein